MADYKHGTYGEFSESVGGVVAETQSAFVYVGTAPVNLIRGYAGAVNTPILLRTFDAANVWSDILMTGQHLPCAR